MKTCLFALLTGLALSIVPGLCQLAPNPAAVPEPSGIQDDYLKTVVDLEVDNYESFDLHTLLEDLLQEHIDLESDRDGREMVEGEAVKGDAEAEPKVDTRYDSDQVKQKYNTFIDVFLSRLSTSMRRSSDPMRVVLQKSGQMNIVDPKNAKFRPGGNKWNLRKGTKKGNKKRNLNKSNKRGGNKGKKVGNKRKGNTNNNKRKNVNNKKRNNNNNKNKNKKNNKNNSNRRNNGNKKGKRQGKEFKLEDVAEGDAVEGDAVEGDAVEGDAIEGDAAEGDAVERDAIKGDAAEGDAVERDAIKGDAVEGDAVEEDAVEGDVGEGESEGRVKREVVVDAEEFDEDDDYEYENEEGREGKDLDEEDDLEEYEDELEDVEEETGLEGSRDGRSLQEEEEEEDKKETIEGRELAEGRQRRRRKKPVKRKKGKCAAKCQRARRRRKMMTNRRRQRRRRNRGKRSVSPSLIISGVSKFRRVGDVRIEDLENAQNIKADFIIGPILMKAEKKILNGKQNAGVRKAEAMASNVNGLIIVQVRRDGVATVKNIMIKKPNVVQVSGSLDPKKRKGADNALKGLLRKSRPVISRRMKKIAGSILNLKANKVTN